MIVLTVTSFNGERVQGPRAQLDELGGTIGRADTNQLVLPDPERTISRVHARIVFRNGRFAIIDSGSNPISVNGVTAAAGREMPLAPGDRLQIGGYAVEVSAPAQAASADPFADLFGDAAIGLATPAPARPAPPAARPPVPPPAAPAWPSSTSADAPAAAWRSATAPPVSRAPQPAPAAIPEDWDPFAPDTPAEDLAAPATPTSAGGAPAWSTSAAAAPASAIGAVQGSSLDDLFGLAAAPRHVDPLGASPARAQLQGANTAGDADPLRALAGSAAAPAPSRSDHVSELNTPMPLPPTAARSDPSALPPGAVLSWDGPGPDSRVITLPGVHQTDVASPAAPTPSPPVPRPAPAAARGSAAGRPGAAAGDLRSALLQGLGMPGLDIGELTPHTLQLVGQLLRESMRGTVELLVARAALKREMRAEMTMIAPRENNPLKFSPSVEVALNHLLGPAVPGFMPPATAVRDAFDDLRAHQLGVMAGMRAALEGVLQRFDPQQLEAKLTRRSAIDSLIPATRKARLWEQFQELFGQLQAEAQDDFDELFGRAFLRAYEDQLERLQREPGPD